MSAVSLVATLDTSMAEKWAVELAVETVALLAFSKVATKVVLSAG